MNWVFYTPFFPNSPLGTDPANVLAALLPNSLGERSDWHCLYCEQQSGLMTSHVYQFCTNVDPPLQQNYSWFICTGISKRRTKDSHIWNNIPKTINILIFDGDWNKNSKAKVISDTILLAVSWTHNMRNHGSAVLGKRLSDSSACKHKAKDKVTINLQRRATGSQHVLSAGFIAPRGPEQKNRSPNCMLLTFNSK